MQKPSAILFLPFLVAACSSSPPAPAPSAAVEQGRSAQTSQAPAAAKPAPSALDELANRLGDRSVYFPYDDFSVDAKYGQTLSAHASYLTHNPAARVVLEGNTDERGSSEYNLALGQKRAEAVRQSLKLGGVADNQIEAVSFGKERPKASCHDEKCWHENRRTDIAYPAGR
jgi:peptidoglycan-associated lipoprotein